MKDPAHRDRRERGLDPVPGRFALQGTQCLDLIGILIRLLPIIPRIKLADRMEIIPPRFPKFISKSTGQPEPALLFPGNIDPLFHDLLNGPFHPAFIPPPFASQRLNFSLTHWLTPHRGLVR